MARPRLRAGLIFAASSLALMAAFRAELPFSLSALIALLVIGLAVYAVIQGPGQYRLERIDDGRVRLRPPAGPCMHGALQPSYCSGFYCAFTIHDPVAGSKRVGLFRDELETDEWRRLRVALRTHGRD